MAELNSKILIVDDEPQIRRFLRAGLSTQGYDLIEAVNGAEALAKTATDHPDLMILDLGLPDGDGTDVILKIREWTKVPIIVLSVRASEQDKIKALDSGADDFLTKPFSVGELLARIRTALRHVAAPEHAEPEFVLDRLRVDFMKRRVTLDGAEVHLSRKEYDILRALIAHAGRVLTHQQLLREIWGAHSTDQTQYLRVYIGQLRHKLERDPAQPEFLLTEPGVGYRLKLPGE